MSSIYKVLDLLEEANASSHYEDEIVTRAGILADLAIWAYCWGHDGITTGEAISFLSYMRREARKYEASLDEEV